MSTYRNIDLLVDGSTVYCRPHRSESCSECDLDLSPLNSLYRALLQVKGEIPLPNAFSQKITTQISGLRESGNKYFKEQNYPEAIKLYTYAIDMSFQRPVWEPGDLVATEVSHCLSKRSLANLNINSLVNAYVDAEWGIRLRPESAECYPLKGKALMGLKRYEEAVKAFDISLGFTPNDENLKSAREAALKLMND